MDSILQSLLDSQDEMKRERLFDELIEVRTVPLVRRVLWQRLGFYVNPDGKSSHNADAGDLSSRILLKLRERLRELLAEPEKNPIDDYKQFVIGVATDECQNYLRARSGPRARLKNNLWGLLKRNGEFKVWTEDDGMVLCGFAAWEGRRISIASTSRLARLKENPELITPSRRAKKNLQQAPYTKLVAEIFNSLGDPIEFEDLVELVALIRNVTDEPPESIEAAEEAEDRQLADTEPRTGERLEKKEEVMKLWEEVKQLPPNCRIALCLSPVGEEGEDLWDLLLATDIVSLPELADGLEIPLDRLMMLWLQAPMDSKMLADYFGVTESQIARWRLQSVGQLRERLGGKNG